MTNPITRPYVKVIAVPNPALGAEWSLAAAEGAMWRVLSVVFTLTTSAVVNNRSVRVVADDGTTEFFRTRAGSPQAAGLVGVHSMAEGFAAGGTVTTNQMLSWPARGVWLPRGHRLRSQTDLLDAGDQYSAIGVEVEIFPEGAGVEWHPGPAPYASEEY